MNRRTFLAALAALPVVGRVFASALPPAAPESIDIGYPVPVRPPIPGHWRVVRAVEPIKARSLVVWDQSEKSETWGEIGLVRGCWSRDDLERHAAIGQAAVTRCDVDVFNYTVVDTRGGLVRVKGAAE